MSNGLDDLAKKRRRGRQTPAPKHPRSEQEQGSAPQTSTEQPAAADETAPLPEPEQPAPASASSDAQQQRPDALRFNRPPSIEAYLDEELMDKLWEVEAAGAARRERHLQSPVVRLALRELFKRYTPAQIVEQVLAASPPKTGKRGRPRR
ncbi:hypothetical protein [Allosalinactinospora lopnorensis]|uniref:hypothetical protein n=1 Tax=Allosalinactinospora lopnorensis TaxID=1352348 RepID=UPI0012E2CD4C|nr:hypothetical protein [Allosalinactinospora lopnorensis]